MDRYMTYRLGKRAISQFIRSDCRRRLRLDLYKSDSDRLAAKGPKRDTHRPGFALLTQAGRSHERQKFNELAKVLPGLVIHGETKPFEEGEELAFGKTMLADHLGSMTSGQLVIEGEYTVTASFIEAHGLEDLTGGRAFSGSTVLELSSIRPDILQVTPPETAPRRAIRVDGGIDSVTDGRLGLKIIDIKISGEASPAHFAELAYYGMTLAGWLIDHGFDDRFFVLAEAAVWPGKHDASEIEIQLRKDRKEHITVPEPAKYLAALARDLEHMPPEVVLGRICRFLRHDLRQVLLEPSWRDLPWHVDSRCSGCDYLGYKWSTEEDAEAGIATEPTRSAREERPYCWTMAKDKGHPSRVAGLTEGAHGKLRERGIDSVQALSEASAGNPVFETHQALRAKRTVLVARGKAMIGALPADIPDRAGTSAVLPSFSDIRVFISADFDVGSGLTFALGSLLVYGVPNAPRAPGKSYGRERKQKDRSMLVTERSVDAEGKILGEWLKHLVQDVMLARQETLAGYRLFDQKKKDVSIQFYVWDRLVFNHLCRIMGRHLDVVHAPVAVGDTDFSPASWLFPADTVLEDARFTSVSSPLTVVSEIVNSLVASTVPHHYGLVNLANDMDADRRVRDGKPPWKFNVNKFYLDPLSDQIPSERGSEVWERKSPFKSQDYQWHQRQVLNVVKSKLSALEWVVRGLNRRLRDSLSSEAPNVGNVFSPIDALTGVGFDGQLIYQHTRLMNASQQLENDLLMAMPPHEREARYDSARVQRTLIGDERIECLRTYGLQNRVGERRVFVFELRDASKEARFKENDYLVSFFPEDLLAQVQHQTVASFKRDYPALEQRVPTADWDFNKPLRGELRANVLRFDRANRRLIIEASRLLDEIVALGIASFDFDAKGRFGILDKVVTDFFSRRLKIALSGKSGAAGIRNPPLAISRPLFTARIANIASKKPRATPSVPAEDFIWNADVAAASPTGADSATVMAIVRQINPNITPKQLSAIERSVERHLAIWWGPPGTGKSATAQSYLAAILKAAAGAGAGVRIAITAVTWVAIDHVARKLPALLKQLGIEKEVLLVRLTASADVSTGVAPELREHLLSMADLSQEDNLQLEAALAAGDRLVVVASTVDQMAKLGGGNGVASLFDVMLIDEASQADVAHAIVAFTKLAPGARVTVVGDDLQMAPVHPIEAPVGAEHIVGSIFDFYRNYRKKSVVDTGIERVMLDRSFRSNAEIIDFVKLAGYPELHASLQSADLRFATENTLSASAPKGWHSEVPWSASYASILDPAAPLVALIHNDRFSSQRNQEEADVVAGLVLTLFEAGLMDLESGNATRYDPTDFFRKGIGIVTPHRAQQAAVFERLSVALADRVDANEIFAAVDTVERFQGQEKAVMIASFGLGDKDQIAAEEVFLFSLNRFNVTASRAKAKFIAIMSRRMVDHLPSDKVALHQSRLLKHFVDGFLQRSETVSMPGFDDCELRKR